MECCYVELACGTVMSLGNWLKSTLMQFHEKIVFIPIYFCALPLLISVSQMFRKTYALKTPFLDNDTIIKALMLQTALICSVLLEANFHE